jgi:hypothetical protein
MFAMEHDLLTGAEHTQGPTAGSARPHEHD